MLKFATAIQVFLLLASPIFAVDMSKDIDAATMKIMPQVVEWRRHLHQYPELGNSEVKTAKYVENHLRKLGFEVKTGVAKTGIVAILRGVQPGPVIGFGPIWTACP